jgi:heat-inducible transcriptional repressor
VDAHIATAEPVGSKAIARLSDLGVSPATIRSVLGSLHERGLIDQPHTSAGRIPTDRGFRYYVDCLLRLQAPTSLEHNEIAARIEDAGAVDLAMREASRVLSRLTQQTCVVLAPRTDTARLKQIDFVRLRDDAVLVILVTSEGLVQNRLVDWPKDRVDLAPNSGDLDRMGRWLTSILEGRTLHEGRAALKVALAEADEEFRALQENAVALGQVALDGSRAQADVHAIHVEGKAHLLGRDDASVTRTRELLALLDEKERVQLLFDEAERAPGIRVFIGEENPTRALLDHAIIRAPYNNGLSVVGALGVIGPRHIDYSRVVPLVDLTAQVVSRLLSQG